eukprot:m.112107 g.112107  ORF g.112107 m.112107 type:complete len:350 (+) comp16159_c1_seq1:190-1239(+)
MSLFGEPANKNAAAKQPGFRAPWHPVQEPARPVTAEPSKRLDWETGQKGHAKAGARAGIRANSARFARTSTVAGNAGPDQRKLTPGGMRCDPDKFKRTDVLSQQRSSGAPPPPHSQRPGKRVPPQKHAPTDPIQVAVGGTHRNLTDYCSARPPSRQWEPRGSAQHVIPGPAFQTAHQQTESSRRPVRPRSAAPCYEQEALGNRRFHGDKYGTTKTIHGDTERDATFAAPALRINSARFRPTDPLNVAPGKDGRGLRTERRDTAGLRLDKTRYKPTDPFAADPRVQRTERRDTAGLRVDPSKYKPTDPHAADNRVTRTERTTFGPKRKVWTGRYQKTDVLGVNPLPESDR